MEALELGNKIGTNAHPLEDHYLLPEIFSFLPLEDRVRAAETCQRWCWLATQTISQEEMATALEFALKGGYENIAGALAEKMTNLDAGLEVAAKMGRVKMVDLFLSKGAKLASLKPYCAIAFAEGHAHFREAVLKSLGSTANQHTLPALQLAMMNGRHEMAAALARRYPDVEDGMALALLWGGGSEKVVGCFLERGAKLTRLTRAQVITFAEQHPKLLSPLLEAAHLTRDSEAFELALNLRCHRVAEALAHTIPWEKKELEMARYAGAHRAAAVLLDRKLEIDKKTTHVAQNAIALIGIINEVVETTTQGIDFEGLFAGLDDDSDDLYG